MCIRDRARVLDREAQHHLSAVFGQGLDTETYPSGVGELHGIGQQVDQRLRQSHQVTPHPPGQAGRVDQQFQALAAGLVGHHPQGPAQQLVAEELGIGQGHLARIDLGQVEDVVDDVEQVPRGVVDLGQACLLYTSDAADE